MTRFTRPNLLEWSLHDVINGPVLRANGVTKEERETLIRRQHLFRAHRDVFYVADRPCREGVWLAAVLRCGEKALLGLESAGALWQVLEHDPGGPHVVLPHARGTRPPKCICVHRTRTLREQDIDEIHHIPVTSLFRSLDDISRRVDEQTLKSALRQAERRYSVDLGALHEYARSPRLRRLIERYVPGQGKTDSPLEALFYEICARSTLPPPDMQRKTAGGRVDFIWLDLGLIVEVDGYDAHSGIIAFVDDRRRDRRNRREGKETLRFTFADLSQIPDDVIDDLNAAHARLGGR